MTTIIFSLSYSQNGCAAEDGPTLADFWSRDTAEAACPDDCVVIAHEVDEALAEEICE